MEPLGKHTGFLKNSAFKGWQKRTGKVVTVLDFMSFLSDIPSHPGLHQKQYRQEVEGCECPPLVHSGETPPEVLCPALGSPAKEGHGLLE